MKHILFCNNCKLYTMKDVCPKCGAETASTKPAKFSIEDKWAKYRLQSKIEAEKVQKTE